MENRVKSIEAAELLGISRRRVQQLTKAGILSSRKEGREHTYEPGALLQEFRNYTEVHPDELENGRRKLERARALEGTRIGVLTIEGIHEIRSGQIFLRARCDCGNLKRIPFETLTGRQYKSCGGACKLHS